MAETASGEEIVSRAMHWMQARIRVEELTAKRLQYLCEHELPSPNGDYRDDTKPCWKMHFEGHEELRGEWLSHRPRAAWCDSCLERQVVHEQLVHAKSTKAQSQRVLTRLLRARVMAP